MYLYVDFSDLRLSSDWTDIEVDEGGDASVGKLITSLCEGIGRLSGEAVPDASGVSLYGPKGNRIDAAVRLRDLALNDWDAVYLIRRQTK